MKNIKNKRARKNARKKIYIIIFLICLIFIKYKSKLIMKISPIDDMEKLELYLNFCNSNISRFKYFGLIKFPKVSIISPIFNRGEYLLRFLKSIQNQYFNDIEIILIDDFSSDNTLDLIKKYF